MYPNIWKLSLGECRLAGVEARTLDYYMLNGLLVYTSKEFKLTVRTNTSEEYKYAT